MDALLNLNTSQLTSWNRGTAVWNNDYDTAYLYDSLGNLIDSNLIDTYVY